MAPPTYALVSTFRPIKVLMVDFQTKSLNKKKVFVVRDEAPYFSEALGFSLPSLLVNPVMPSADELDVQTTDISDVLAIGNDLELPPHQKCAAHLLNLVCTSDCDAAEKSLEYIKISRSTFAKCEALWNKTSRSPLASEAVANESPLLLIRPCATRWNSVYDAVKRLNQIIDAKGSQALHNLCQRLDLPR